MRRFLSIISIIITLATQASAADIVCTSGSLGQAVGNDTDATSLKVSGTINAADFDFISKEMTALTTLDLSEASIEAYHGDPIITGRTDFKANTLPEYALAGTNISQLMLPLNLMEIGEGALLGTPIKTINLPASLEIIGNSAFVNCDSLTSVEIKCEIIRDYAFMDCDNLNSVVIGNAADVINKAVFKNCKNLASVSLPSVLSIIGNESFAGCSSLTTVKFPSTLSQIGDRAFYNSGVESIDLTNTNVRKIGQWAFANCDNLRSATLNDNIITIGQAAFFDCPNLATYNTPASCSTIEQFAHKGNTSLQTDKLLHDNITTIGDYALMGMNHVAEFIIPASIDSIGNNAFENWASLVSLYATNLYTVPRLGQDVWNNVDQSNATLYVNAETCNAFAVADQWKDFNISITVGIENTLTDDNAVKAHFSGSDLIITADQNIALVSVYDSWGRQYAIVQPNSDNITIDTSAWGNNIYIIKVILDNATTASFKLSRR